MQGGAPQGGQASAEAMAQYMRGMAKAPGPSLGEVLSPEVRLLRPNLLVWRAQALRTALPYCLLALRRRWLGRPPMAAQVMMSLLTGDDLLQRLSEYLPEEHRNLQVGAVR